MKGKVAFITGASRGIGAAIAEEMAKNGFELALNARSECALLQKAKELSEKYHVTCLPFVGDAGDDTFIKKTFAEIEQKLGTVDVVVNNAGISHIGLLTDMELSEWNQIVNTNLTSVFLCSKYAARQMIRKQSGRIINISSVWGNVGASCEVAYSATKGGMNAFTKALAKELAPSNIQVNAIACGTIDTEMNQCFSEEERKVLEEENPSGRFGRVEEVAELVYSLVEAPEYLTGQIITMDGGWI